MAKLRKLMGDDFDGCGQRLLRINRWELLGTYRTYLAKLHWVFVDPGAFRQLRDRAAVPLGHRLRGDPPAGCRARPPRVGGSGGAGLAAGAAALRGALRRRGGAGRLGQPGRGRADERVHGVRPRQVEERQGAGAREEDGGGADRGGRRRRPAVQGGLRGWLARPDRAEAARRVLRHHLRPQGRPGDPRPAARQAGAGTGTEDGAGTEGWWRRRRLLQLKTPTEGGSHEGGAQEGAQGVGEEGQGTARGARQRAAHGAGLSWDVGICHY